MLGDFAWRHAMPGLIGGVCGANERGEGCHCEKTKATKQSSAGSGLVRFARDDVGTCVHAF
jgi:hypothetical protein